MHIHLLEKAKTFEPSEIKSLGCCVQMSDGLCPLSINVQRVLLMRDVLQSRTVMNDFSFILALSKWSTECLISSRMHFGFLVILAFSWNRNTYARRTCVQRKCSLKDSYTRVTIKHAKNHLHFHFVMDAWRNSERFLYYMHLISMFILFSVIATL